MACVQLGNLHVCFAGGETKRVPNMRRKRFWCFRCRKRLLHTRMVLEPEPMSYYGPTFWWECERCHEEHVLFPGCDWEYGE